MESIGETLRTARIEKNVSLEDVARATRIKLDILEKMEGDEFSALPSPMYVKGFLKLYTEYLGLNSQPIIDSFLSRQGGVSHHKLQLETEITTNNQIPVMPKMSGRKAIMPTLILLIIISLCGITYLFWNRSKKMEITETEVPGSSIIEPHVQDVPTAKFDAYYNPQITLPPELIELPD